MGNNSNSHCPFCVIVDGETMQCDNCRLGDNRETTKLDLMQEAEERLISRLALKGFELRDVIGDGNCFFRAIAVQLPSTNYSESYHMVVRDTMCRYLEHNEDVHMMDDNFISSLASDGQTFQQFLTLCQTSTKYVTSHIEVRETACALHINIWVFTTSGVDHRFMGTNDDPNDPTTPFIHVALLEQKQHYVAAIPTTGLRVRPVSPSATTATAACAIITTGDMQTAQEAIEREVSEWTNTTVGAVRSLSPFDLIASVDRMRRQQADQEDEAAW